MQKIKKKKKRKMKERKLSQFDNLWGSFEGR